LTRHLEEIMVLRAAFYIKIKVGEVAGVLTLAISFQYENIAGCKCNCRFRHRIDVKGIVS
jgi:hypothetical protein